MHHVIVLMLFWVNSLPAAAAPSAQCQFALDPKTVVTQWTAFKTTEKIAVTGTFAHTKLIQGEGPIRNARLDRLLASLQAEIPLTADQIKTGNPARDQTLYESFFKKAGAPSLTGKIRAVKAKGSIEPQGTFELRLQSAKNKISVPFTFELKGEDLIAKGSLDVLKFGLSAAFESLHEACKMLHTGPDGVSKTWTTVDLQLSAKVTRICP